MQLLELTLEELVELALKKSGMRLPRRIAREWCKRGILRHWHSSKEPRDIIRSGSCRSHRNRPWRDLGNPLCRNAEHVYQDRDQDKSGGVPPHSKICKQFPLSVRAWVWECALRCAAFSALAKLKMFVLPQASFFHSERRGRFCAQKYSNRPTSAVASPASDSIVFQRKR